MSYLSNGTFVLQSGEGRLIPGPEGLTVKVGTDESAGAVAVLESMSEPGFGPPLHIHHSSEELFYVLSGEFECQIGDERVRATAGSFLLVPRGVAHAPRAVGSGPGKVLIIFAPGGPDKVFDELAALAAETGGPPDPDDEHVRAILSRHDSQFVGPPLQ